jgi:hypothetical protein
MPEHRFAQSENRALCAVFCAIHAQFRVFFAKRVVIFPGYATITIKQKIIAVAPAPPLGRPGREREGKLN